MRKIFLRGCNGRMGQTISRLCEKRTDAMIVAGLDIIPEKRFKYPVYADPMEFNGYADVMVDFSAADHVENLLGYCARRHFPLVLCTTGYNDAQRVVIEETARNIPIFLSGNMSLGILLLSDLAKRAAEFLGGDFDVEIIEKHHKDKTDAPSGTALMLLDALKTTLPYKPHPVYDRHAVRHKRTKNEIGLHTVRGGSIVGEHEIIFAGHDETVTLSHSAGSREIFAAGAIRAALYLSESAREPGLYDMRDLL